MAIRKTHDEYIKQLEAMHGDLIECLGTYTCNRESILHRCNNCAHEWIASPKHTIKGCGCPICANKKRSVAGVALGSTWRYRDWKKAGERSNNFDSFKVYVIKCYGNNEIFYKIGKTFNTLSRRFSKDFPYEYEVTRVVVGDADYISKLEKQLHRDNKDRTYVPKLQFNGMYECFTHVNIEGLNNANCK